jgi:DNA end-binding protein Ku
VATAVWRGQLSFGLLTFPVKLYAAARRQSVSFRNLRRREEEDQPEPLTATVAAPVQSRKIALAAKPAPAAPEPVYTSEERVTPVAQVGQLAGEPVPAVVKGFEFEKDRFVAIDPAEIRKLARGTSRDLEVTEFVRWEEIDPVYLDASYFIVPDPSGTKPYSLLFAAMKKTGFAAIAQLAMHGREQIFVIRFSAKGLTGHTMFYASEIRREQEFSAVTDTLKDKEVNLAAMLIKEMAEVFQPERFVNAYQERVKALVEAKVQRVPAQAVTEQLEPASRKPPVNILDALKRSLEKAAERKAPQKSQPAAHTKRRSA